MPTAFGCTLSSEEHAPIALVDNARKAEDAGFSFVSISDHSTRGSRPPRTAATGPADL
jgi:hypothetical protein